MTQACTCRNCNAVAISIVLPAISICTASGIWSIFGITSDRFQNLIGIGCSSIALQPKHPLRSGRSCRDSLQQLSALDQSHMQGQQLQQTSSNSGDDEGAHVADTAYASHWQAHAFLTLPQVLHQSHDTHHAAQTSDGSWVARCMPRSSHPIILKFNPSMCTA